jgi:hypothetical protein
LGITEGLLILETSLFDDISYITIMHRAMKQNGEKRGMKRNREEGGMVRDPME